MTTSHSLSFLLASLYVLTLAACSPTGSDVHHDSTDAIAEPKRDLEMDADAKELGRGWGQDDQPQAVEDTAASMRLTISGSFFKEDLDEVRQLALDDQSKNEVRALTKKMILKLVDLANRFYLDANHEVAMGYLHLSQALGTILNRPIPTPLPEGAHFVFTALSGQDFVANDATLTFQPARPFRRELALLRVFPLMREDEELEMALHLREWDSDPAFQNALMRTTETVRKSKSR